jgi:WD40 repeat protein
VLCLPDDVPTTPCPARTAGLSSLQSAHAADINSLRWEPSGKLLASCSDDGSVKIWQATAEKPVHTLAGVAARCVLLAGHLALLGCCLQRLGDLAGRALIPAGNFLLPSFILPRPCVLAFVRAGHVGPVTAVRWGQSSGGKSQLASCGDDGSVRVWDVEAGACVHVFDEHDSVSWPELASAKALSWRGCGADETCSSSRHAPGTGQRCKGH